MDILKRNKQITGRVCIKKTIIIFSDGCAAQLKNKSSLLKLCFFEKDFGIKGEWNFFATSHGKGAVDRIGGAVSEMFG